MEAKLIEYNKEYLGKALCLKACKDKMHNELKNNDKIDKIFNDKVNINYCDAE